MTDIIGQDIWQSDMKVEMTQRTSGSYQIYNILVSTENNDASRSPHLIFTLPKNSKAHAIEVNGDKASTTYQVYGNAAQALPHNPTQEDGYIKVDFPNLNKQEVKISITLIPIGKGLQRNDGASAFIFSLTPELNKENNFIYLPLNR